MFTLSSSGKTAAVSISMAHDKKERKHHKRAHKKSGVHGDVDAARPVEQNAAAIAALGPHPTHHADVPRSGRPGEGPQATSMPGHVAVIHNVQKPGRGAHGIPGIISSTSLGPEVRGRLMDGIIISAMGGKYEQGPVTKVAGMDATAYNAGMSHIAGSRFK